MTIHEQIVLPGEDRARPLRNISHEDYYTFLQGNVYFKLRSFFMTKQALKLTPDGIY